MLQFEFKQISFKILMFHHTFSPRSRAKHTHVQLHCQRQNFNKIFKFYLSIAEKQIAPCNSIAD